MSNVPNDFSGIKLKLASPEKVLEWSHGEVKKPETVNYRTQRPEKDGLFCERIFGPTKDWECYCGKYKRIRYKGIVCDKCGVEVTRSIVRRERMGHISLAAPVTHVWFLRGIPSKIGLMLDISAQNLEKVIYFASYIITSVDLEAKEDMLSQAADEFKKKKKGLKKIYEAKIQEIRNEALEKKAQSKAKNIDVRAEKQALKLEEEKEKQSKELGDKYNQAKKEIENIKKLSIISEIEYRTLSMKYGHVFEAGIGAEAVRRALEEVDLKEGIETLKQNLIDAPASQKKKIRRRLNLYQHLNKNEIRPEWTVLNVLPVIPPDLRPMVQLDGGRFAASDLNDLYRRVINRNNRLKRLIEINAPEVICRNEKRMLQEAVDALIDNSARHGKAVASTSGQKRVLKSLADMLRGKQGRFRQNLLGKRVDYSGRSVIVIGPNLTLGECGIPKTMALELFKPFVINELIEQEHAHNIRSASRLIEEKSPEVWDMLEEVIKGHFIMINRAPTLHRLGIQAFQPVLIEGKAIQIHPMVCTAFNADFDGDQMAVHVPLTEPAQKEAREIMSSTTNLLKPATGKPIVIATQDIVLGCYYISTIKPGEKGEGKYFASVDEAMIAFEHELITLRSKIHVRIAPGEIVETCVGRIFFNTILPKEMGFVNVILDKRAISSVIAKCLNTLGNEETVEILDKLKVLGFKYLTKSGLSWGMDDLQVPVEKKEILGEAEKQVEEIRQQYKSGFLTDSERYVKTIETWATAKDNITKVSTKTLDEYGPVYAMVESGARGSWPQIVQIMGMRGLMAAPSGKTIELPVRDSFKEGLGVLEYFISTHGARKGLSDTALRTANAGYLTRRLIDVAQDMVVFEKNCGAKESIEVNKKDSDRINETVGSRSLGRTAAQDIVDPKTGEVIIKSGKIVGDEEAKKIDDADIEAVNIRSVITCKALRGLCSKCYGWDLGNRKQVEIGQAVGIVAAQSIGEPGTQLTMRTFHTGGVAGDGDITQGLPRVEELFEARNIKKPAVVAELDGVCHVKEEGEKKIINIVSKDVKKADIEKDFKKGSAKVKNDSVITKGTLLGLSTEGKQIKAPFDGIVRIEKDTFALFKEGTIEKQYTLPSDSILWVQDGDLVVKGQQLTEGHVDVQHLFKVAGRKVVQKYILGDVQYIYASQGQEVNDKHVEIIIRQMLSKVVIREEGESEFLVGDVISRAQFFNAISVLKKDNKKPPVAEDLLLGITKASLSTESFLAGASFQETAKVLIDAAIAGKVDHLRGLKENVIIGKLIPVGTAFRKPA
ncbi:DNA-directed RNA polymerase subunit beta' [Patescibacteria group bacterium]|nr:DNA-directed RNA polymerase subunit beta' [Patescibacteria group bacterium]